MIVLLFGTPFAGATVQETAVEELKARLRTSMTQGLYGEAEAEAEAFLTKKPGAAEIWTSLGKARLAVGEWDRAEQAFEEALRTGSDERLAAELNLALMSHRRGQRDRAQNQFERILDYYRGQNVWSSEDLTAVAEAVSYLGHTRPAMYRAAIQLYSNAIKVDPDNLEARIKLGNLLLDKYNNTEALEVFREVLASEPQHPEALLGLARSQHFDHSSEALATTRQALIANPHLVPGWVFLSRLQIESEQYADALASADKALETNPASLEALTVKAAIHYLTRDEKAFEAVLRRAFALNPNYAELYSTLAELAARNRLYGAAVVHAAKAVELDPRSWRGFGLLGMNQLRIGEIDTGRQNLEAAFLGDPYNVWIKNTLDLVDTFSEYQVHENQYFRFMAHSGEAAVLAPYLQPLATEVFEEFVDRYDYRPSTPIRIELYPHHADFSVRTVGLAGLGILGVSFGPVVALDSPSAREKGRFNWGSTLLHELAHSFHLELSDHRAPRWLSEGLAVHEERRSRPGWGQDVDPGFLQAFTDGRLLPVERLNDGFVRPVEPQQIGHSYYQASLVVELIEDNWGFDALRNMLVGYADGASDSEVMESVLGIDAETFDRRFSDHLRERFSEPLEALQGTSSSTAPLPDSPDKLIELAAQEPGDYRLQMRIARRLLKADVEEAAEAGLLHAQTLFPQYAGADSSYWALAQLYSQQGNRDAAIGQLEAMVALNAEHYAAHTLLAEHLGAQGETRRAAEILNRAIYIYPFDIQMHETLAGYYAELGEWTEAAREYRAVVVLDPVDLPFARYQLADAQLAAGNLPEARSEVLRTLELAPHYEAAQELLLKIREIRLSNGAPPGGRRIAPAVDSTPTLEASD